MGKLNEVYVEKIQKMFPALNLLVIGDLMVDEYVYGSVSRISPEAPIPVLNYNERDRIAGGASNVANNLVALGCHVTMIGVASQDEYGTWLRKDLKSRGINIEGIHSEAGRPTTVKRRFATKHQQLLRMDIESGGDITEKTKQSILEYIHGCLSLVKAVVLSDYNKGVLLSPEFIKKIVSICNERNVSVCIDSKSKDISSFKGATFVKPNNFELEQAVNIPMVDDSSLELAGRRYLELSQTEALVLTRGAEGISVFKKDEERKDFPADAVQVFDVTGAGDTVISVVALGIASGLSLYEAVNLGNLAAGIVVSKRGTAAVSAEELVDKINEKKNKE